jgi:hypothetical protein
MQRFNTLDQLKYEHYGAIAEHTRRAWSNVLKWTTSAVCAQVKILEKISNKGLQNDCLGKMIASVGDPFNTGESNIITEDSRTEIVQR